MIFLWTKNNSPGSFLIRTALNGKSSHFALAFDEDSQGHGIVFQSNLIGAHLTWLPNYVKANKVVWALEFKQPLREPEEEFIYKEIVNTYHGKSYDYGALAFWTKSLMEHRLFGKKLPEKNEWGSIKDPLCTGIARGLKLQTLIDFKIKWPKDLDMIAPDDLYLVMSESPILKPRLLVA